MVIARPIVFGWPSVSGLAPMMCDVGHPITHNPSIKACVDKVPSFANNSSEISVAFLGGPEAMHRTIITAVLFVVVAVLTMGRTVGKEPPVPPARKNREDEARSVRDDARRSILCV
jgi:hypothetical protein